jgi:hypothetical protein
MTTIMATADHAAQQRHLALTDCVDQTRRAASAALAAACGESDDVRLSALVDARRNLLAVLHELQRVRMSFPGCDIGAARRSGALSGFALVPLFKIA